MDGFCRTQDYLGDKCTGFYADGNMEGFGEVCFINGTKSIGYHEGNQRNGINSYIYQEGIYFGEFVNLLMNGNGIYKYNDGEIYVGQWKDDMENGKGIQIKVGNLAYNGDWKNGKMHGKAFYAIRPDKNQPDGLRV